MRRTLANCQESNTDSHHAALSTMQRVALAAALILIAGAAIAHWYYSGRGRFTTAPE